MGTGCPGADAVGIGGMRLPQESTTVHCFDSGGLAKWPAYIAELAALDNRGALS